jgi:hypothetical protein
MSINMKHFDNIRMDPTLTSCAFARCQRERVAPSLSLNVLAAQENIALDLPLPSCVSIDRELFRLRAA